MTPNAREEIAISIDGATVRVAAGTTVAAALINAGTDAFRRSVRGTARGPVCGMGICHECRVTIDGRRHQRSCMIAVSEGMAVSTETEAAISIDVEHR